MKAGPALLVIISVASGCRRDVDLPTAADVESDAQESLYVGTMHRSGVTMTDDTVHIDTTYVDTVRVVSCEGNAAITCFFVGDVRWWQASIGPDGSFGNQYYSPGGGYGLSGSFILGPGYDSLRVDHNTYLYTQYSIATRFRGVRIN